MEKGIRGHIFENTHDRESMLIVQRDDSSDGVFTPEILIGNLLRYDQRMRFIENRFRISQYQGIREHLEERWIDSLDAILEKGLLPVFEENIAQTRVPRLFNNFGDFRFDAWPHGIGSRIHMVNLAGVEKILFHFIQ